MESWRANILDDDAKLRELIRGTKRVAVLGIKTEAQGDQPSFYVPQFLASKGIEIVPVPIYYPDVQEILGKKVHRKLAEVPGELDIVDVFRRPADVMGHVPELLEKRPRAVWLQLGIRNDEAAEALARAGIRVVQDRCLMVEYRRHAG